MKRYLLFFLFIFYNGISQIAITEVYYDTPYTEISPRLTTWPHHLGEYIELYNYSTEDILLDGWCITDVVSKFEFPSGITIGSNQYLIVAYRKNTNENYFPQFFPNTVGHESQIIYQDQIILRNKVEHVNLTMGKLRGHDFEGIPVVSEMKWNFVNPPPSNEEQGYENPGTVDYYKNSYHYLSPSQKYVSQASPLNSQTPPSTMALEDIPVLSHIYTREFDNLTWKYYADLLLNASCPNSITNISQFPPGPYVERARCFYYDVAGNNVASSECPYDENGPDPGEPPAEEYTAAELDEINSYIYIYPVPTSSTVNISWDSTVNGKINEIQISNTAGVSAISPQSISSSQTSAQFNIASQPSGFYILKFMLSSGQHLSRNIIKY